jgi:hypothetical protein
LYKNQQEIKRHPARFKVADCGRRFGKSLLGENEACEVAINGYPVGWFSPKYKYMLDNWRNVNNILAPIIHRTSVQERRIELITGGILEFWTVDTPDVARSRKYKRVIVDEAAMIHCLKPAWEEAIRPTLTDYAGDAYFLSTPKGRNYFWELYNRGTDTDQDIWRSWKFPSAANPYLPQSEILQAKTELPERVFKQEYLADFIEHEGVVFRRVNEAATSPLEHKPHEHKGHYLYFGVDWGKQNDFTVITCVCSTCRQMVLFDRFNQIDYAFQRRRLEAHIDRWKPVGVLPERNSMGEPIIEELQRSGINVLHGHDGKPGFYTSPANKTELIESLAVAIEKGDISIMNQPVLISELLAYERVKTPAGNYKYGAPEGLHDDTVISLALAWNAIDKGGFTLLTG